MNSPKPTAALNEKGIEAAAEALLEEWNTSLHMGGVPIRRRGGASQFRDEARRVVTAYVEAVDAVEVAARWLHDNFAHRLDPTTTWEQLSDGGRTRWRNQADDLLRALRHEQETPLFRTPKMEGDP